MIQNQSVEDNTLAPGPNSELRCFSSLKIKTCSWAPSVQVFVTSGGGTAGRRWKLQNIIQASESESANESESSGDVAVKESQNIRLKVQVKVKMALM